MGQFLASGIVTEMEVYCKKGEKREKNDLDKIREHFSKYFCLDYYELEDDEANNSYIFKIKKEMIEKNFHDGLRDFSRLIEPNCICSSAKVIIDYNSFNQENYPIKCELVNNHDGKKLKITGEKINISPAFNESPPFWLYWDCKLFHRYKIWFIMKRIWIDNSKIFVEDPTCLLYLMNKMKKDYFKHPLAQNTVFYIDG